MMNTVGSCQSLDAAAQLRPPISPIKPQSHYAKRLEIAHNHKILTVCLIALAILAVAFAILSALVFIGQFPVFYNQLGYFTASSYAALSILTTALFAYTAHYLSSAQKPIDKYRLLQGAKKIDHSQQAWHLNAALLRECYEQTDDPELKNEIRFLVTNYLSKIAPPPSFHALMSWFLEEDYDNVIQTNKRVESGYYHRGSCRYPSKEIHQLNAQYALGKSSPLTLTDSDQCNKLFSLHYEVINYNHTNNADIEDQLYVIFSNHFAKYNNLADAFKSPLDKLVLFDSTEYFKECIKTEKNTHKCKIFNERYKAYEKNIQQAIDKVTSRLNPQIKQSEVNKIRNFIKKNTLSLCRVKMDHFAGIKVFPLFIDIKKDLDKRYAHFLEFIDETGLYIGAIHYRKYVLNDLKSLASIRYLPSGQNAIYFEKPASFLEKEIFKSLEKAIQDQSRPKYVAILAQAPLNILKGLFNHISSDSWNQLMQHPQKQVIIQTSLFKLHDLLTTARLFLNDYNKLTQTIELIHCEIITLLSIISPFKEEQFAEIYKNVLKRDLPEEIAQYVHCGLGKASMNLFAGVTKIVDDINPNAVKAYSEGSYFEIVNFLGSARSFNSIRQSDTKVDLYTGTINPNILVDEHHTLYTQIDVAKDIREILEKNAGKPFTVAIDSTIDQINSSAIAALLKEFKSEIACGKINFVILRSGQKFDMLGNDHMFGTACYVVNNDAPYWKPFERLFTEEIHKTDSLSVQWFCLAYKYASEQINAYCQQIFTNAKTILAHVPNRLKPKKRAHQTIRVNAIDNKFEPAFIDIKITGKMHKLKAVYHMVRFFTKLYKTGNVKAQCRASFGFWHPNINIIWGSETCTTIRINPSLDANANQVIIDYLKGL